MKGQTRILGNKVEKSELQKSLPVNYSGKGYVVKMSAGIGLCHKRPPDLEEPPQAPMSLGSSSILHPYY